MRRSGQLGASLAAIHEGHRVVVSGAFVTGRAGEELEEKEVVVVAL